MESQSFSCIADIMVADKRGSGTRRLSLAPLAVAVSLVGLWSSPSSAIDDGFFQLQLSIAAQIIQIEAVDPDTLLTLPTTFTADALGQYQVDALLVADGDTANPIGGFALTGDLGGSLRVAVDIDSVPLGGAVQPSDAFFSIISGIDVAPFATGGPEQVRTTQQTETFGLPGSTPAQLLASSRAFMSTADDKEAAVPGVSGMVPIPGEDELTTGYECIPPLPPDTVESEYSQIVMQQDYGLLDFTTNSIFTVSSVATTELSRVAFSNLSGDYNNNGVIDAADYTVWRDNLGRPAGTLLNDFTGQPVGQTQYNQWVNNFGAMALVGAHSHTVPEPVSSVLLASALATLPRRRARHKSI